MIKNLKNVNLIDNKTILITGTTSGIGLEAVSHLSNLNCLILACVRNTELAEKQLSHLKSKNPKFNFMVYKLDLQDIQSINNLINKIKSDGISKIDYVINNAGIYARPIKKLPCGLEQHFFTNCIAPIYLSKKILPLLNNNSKLIFVSSISIKSAKINKENIDLSGIKNKTKIYANSKLWLTLYLLKWKSNLSSNSKYSIEIVHPGICASSLMSYKNGSFSKFTSATISVGMKVLFHSTKKASLCELAGITLSTNTNEWIGPKIFGIWGLPKRKTIPLKNAILKNSDFCYNHIENILINL